MKIVYVFLFLIILMSSCSIQKLIKNDVYRELAPIEYNAYVVDTSNVIIDVRTSKEYDKTHIERAINLSYFGGKFKKKVKELKIDTTKTIMIYCQTQHRSLFVSNKLYKMGYSKIIDLDKGMKQWQKQNMPVVIPDSSK